MACLYATTRAACRRRRCSAPPRSIRNRAARACNGSFSPAWARRRSPAMCQRDWCSTCCTGWVQRSRRSTDDRSLVPTLHRCVAKHWGRAPSSIPYLGHLRETSRQVHSLDRAHRRAGNGDLQRVNLLHLVAAELRLSVLLDEAHDLGHHAVGVAPIG